MTVLFKNNAFSVLASGLTLIDTSATLDTGNGSRFPSPSGSEWFPVTLIAGDGTIEIARCTARVGDVLTITRAQESTSALTWSAGDRIELRLTAAALEAFIQTGALDALATIAGQYTFKTGMRTGHVGATAPTGFVLGEGGSIGNGTSGGTERANDDTADLFALLWNDHDNAALPIQDSAGAPSSRGASAAADFAANKRMPLPDYAALSTLPTLIDETVIIKL